MKVSNLKENCDTLAFSLAFSLFKWRISNTDLEPVRDRLFNRGGYLNLANATRHSIADGIKRKLSEKP